MRRFVAGMGAILLFFGCMTLAGIGLGIILLNTPRPVALGWLCLAASLALAACTASAWAPTLPGVFGYGVMNSIVMILSGHLIGQPDKRVEQPVAWMITGFLIAMTVLAARMDGCTKSIEFVDRVAFSLLPMFLGAAFIFEGQIFQFMSGVGMLAAMGFLAFRHPRRRGKRRSRHPEESQGPA